MLTLGIETSCDETAAAIVSDAKDIRSNVVLSQTLQHKPYGGVVPEIAARAHIDHIDEVIAQALEQAGCAFSDIDAVAATAGPGLIGGVIVGVMTAKTIASVIKKPFIAVNHLEGHALTARLTDNVPFPYLLLLVSGGHCQFLIAEDVGRYVKLGATVDDALGEAFDKTAKMLGLGYPGGPVVEKLAQRGNERTFDFPVPMKGREGCDFSFSGLKTAVRKVISEKCKVESEKNTLSTYHLPLTTVSDICASFQYAASQSLCDRLENALVMFKQKHPLAEHVVVAGGVAANQYLKQKLQEVISTHAMILTTPPITLCTDNAAMIAWAGIERFRLGYSDGLDFEPRARWPLATA